MHALSKVPPLIYMAHAAVYDLWKQVNLQSRGAQAPKRHVSNDEYSRSMRHKSLDPQSSSKAHDRADRHMPIYAGLPRRSSSTAPDTYVNDPCLFLACSINRFQAATDFLATCFAPAWPACRRHEQHPSLCLSACGILQNRISGT